MIIGIGCASVGVYYYGLKGGIAGQLWVEFLYVVGALRLAYRNGVMPIVNNKII